MSRNSLKKVCSGVDLVINQFNNYLSNVCVCHYTFLVIIAIPPGVARAKSPHKKTEIFLH